MKRNYEFSAFVLAMASVFVMAMPQDASAQGYLKALPKAAKNFTRVGVISGYRAAKGYDNAVRNARLNSNLNRQARLSHINNGVAVGGVKANAVKVLPDTSKNKTKKTGVKRNPKAKQAKVEAQKKKDVLDRESLYARAISALLDDKNKEFVSLIRRSSDAQYAPAQYAYAMSNLERCEGRERYKWLELVRRSADAGYGQACAYISALYDWYGSEGNFENNKDSAYVWARRASDLGSKDGHLLAASYAFERGDTLQGVKYMERAYAYEFRLDSLYTEYYGERSLNYCLVYYEDTHSCASWLAPDMYDNLLSWRVLNAKTEAEHQACYDLAQYVSDELFTSYSSLVLANYCMGFGNLMPAAPEGVVMHLEEASEEIPMATAKLADCYYAGYGVERDSVYAMSLYRDAAERGSAEAMYMLTFLYNDAECYDSVREWGMRPELADSADIQYVVGCSYYNEEEYKKSIDYFVRAAEGGNVYGKWMAYVVYATILCDEDKAFEYVRQAAEAGYPDAMNDLAICYLNADHVDRDVAKALQLFGQAKDAGYLPAYNNLGCVYYAKKSEYGMKPDRKRAARYWYEGAEKGDPNSMFNYAECQIKGKYGVAKNKAEGYGLMRKAAEAGSENAVIFLDMEGK